MESENSLYLIIFFSKIILLIPVILGRLAGFYQKNVLWIYFDGICEEAK
jgi:hypothetical protein